MAYQKTVWEDYPSTDTPITAENLNKMEDGITACDLGITSINTKLNAMFRISGTTLYITTS